MCSGIELNSDGPLNWNERLPKLVLYFPTESKNLLPDLRRRAGS